MSEVERRKLNRAITQEIATLQTKMFELELFITNGLNEATSITKVLEVKLQGIEEAVKSLKATLITINVGFILAFLGSLMAYVSK